MLRDGQCLCSASRKHFVTGANQSGVRNSLELDPLLCLSTLAVENDWQTRFALRVYPLPEILIERKTENHRFHGFSAMIDGEIIKNPVSPNLAHLFYLNLPAHSISSLMDAVCQSTS